MSAMTTFTLKSLRANRVRTFVTIIGVALAAALLTAVMTTYTSLTDYLYRSEADLSGEWMAKVESTDSARLAENLEAASVDPSIGNIAIAREVGFGALTEAQQNKLGTYQTVMSVEGNMPEMLGIYASDGRLPERAGEVLIFKGWNTYENVELGDEITLNVGQRQAISSTADADLGNVIQGEAGFAADLEDIESKIEPGDLLNSSTAYLGEAASGSDLGEHLIDLHEETYTVVGFFDRETYAFASPLGTVAITVDAPRTTNFADVYLTTQGTPNSDAVRAAATEAFPDDNIVLHTALLRFMGIGSDTSLWDTFYGLVAILAVIIILACVSLIFNAFAISVAERTAQFGLLSSVGATRRQLRRAVMVEALIVACVGAPLGILIGIGGCAVTFAVLGPAISAVAGASRVPFLLAVNPWALGLAAGLTLVTVLISVWIPAKRASGANIIDSLRTSGKARVSKRGERIANGITTPAKLWKGGGAFSRLFGVGGKLARINRKRGASKGRTASVSLALAIVLLMTAGSLNSFLGSLVDAVTGGSEIAGEVTVAASFENDGAPTAEPVTPEQMEQLENERFATETRAYQDAYEYLSETPEAQAQGWMIYGEVPMILPTDMVGDTLLDESISMGAGKNAEGDIITKSMIDFVEDSQFDAYAESLGLDPSTFYDAQHPRAIGISRAYGNDGSTYQMFEVLKRTGTVELITGATYLNRYPTFMVLTTEFSSADDLTFDFSPTLYSNIEGMDRYSLRLSDIEYALTDLEVAALAEDTPPIVEGNGSMLTFIVPESLAASNSLGTQNPVFKSAFDSADGDHGALAEELASRGGEYFHSNAPFEMSFYSYNDKIEEMTTTQMVATIVNVFCLLFTIILALIAMANVFNTVTNSLILRRREFAVMRSIGLSNRQFRRMITDECMRFGVAGLIPGLIVSVGVAYLVYRMIGNSMSGMAFNLPWGYVALAVLMTALAMGVSVAYGLHRCRADNVVEALRADSI